MEDNLVNSGKKKKLLGVLCIVVVVLLVAGLILQGVFLFRLRAENEQYRADYAKLNKTYSSEYLHLNSVTLERFYRMLETEEDFVVCVSRPDCGTCRTYESDLLDIYERLGMTEEIYYLNVAELHKDTDAWVAFKARFEIGGTPSFIHIRNGEPVSSTGWTELSGISMEEIEAWLLAQ